MSEIASSANESMETESKLSPHMGKIAGASELFVCCAGSREGGVGRTEKIDGRILVNMDGMSEFFAACTLSLGENKLAAPAAPAEKPSFAKPARRIGRL